MSRVGGVPFFCKSKKQRKTVCGEVTYDELKEWAEGKIDIAILGLNSVD
jgi:hypothetical protein